MKQKFEKYYALRNDNEILINFLNAIFKEKKHSKNPLYNTIDLQMVVDARKTNMTNKQIAMMFGISVSELGYLVKIHDLPRRKPVGRTPRPTDLLVGEKFKKEYYQNERVKKQN